MSKRRLGRGELGWLVKLVTVVVGVYFLPGTMAGNRRYMLQENESFALSNLWVAGEAASGLKDFIVPTTIPYVEGLTELSFSKYHICSDSCIHLLANITAECGGCLNEHHPGSYTQMAKWQLSADVLIAIAYFSIPIELLFFIHRTRVFPYRWVVAQFGCFIVLCGLTHLISVWTFTANSEASFAAMTFFKVVTATISCATAVTMLWVLPELLSVKIRELFLAEKTAELGKEVGMIKKQEEIGRHIQMLTQEIRSSLDRHTILHTTLVELARTLNLQDTGIWMPNLKSRTMEFTHGVEPHSLAAPLAVSMIDETIQTIFKSVDAIVIPQGSDLARLTCSRSCGEMLDGHVAAVRLPLLTTTHFRGSSGSERSMNTEGGLALLVLAIPNNEDRQWGVYDLGLVNSVATQVAVALSHATILEESMRTSEQLLVQNAELKQARLEAEQAMATRNEFLAVMNHEMRTPMHAIIALSSLLLESGLTSDQRAMVDTLTKSSGLLQQLIDDFLDFSKLEINKVALYPECFEFAVLCKEAESILRPVALNKNLNFEWALIDVPTRILADSKRILQILLNVIGNAIKFTTTGHVRVSAYMGASADSGPPCPEMPSSSTKRRPLKVHYRYLHVDVHDTGVGIAANNMGRLFKKFVQADSSTTRQFGGTGLGLAICKKFVELMSGKISLESGGIGLGSTCRVCMRIGVVDDLAGERTPPDSTKNLNETELPNMKVLVVDDNAINRMVTGRLLQRLGCQTVVVDSGTACLKLLSEAGPSAFDVLLLDLCMPEMDGFMVAAEVIKIYGQADRPLIAALTASADARTREKVFEVGMDSILLKPITVNILRKELENLLTLLHGTVEESAEGV